MVAVYGCVMRPNQPGVCRLPQEEDRQTLVIHFQTMAFLLLRVLCMVQPGLHEKWKWRWKLLSRVRLFATAWTMQSMEFSRPEYWSGWNLPSPGDLPNLGIEPRSPALQEDSLPAEPPEKPRILEWITYPFSSRSSQPRNRTKVYCIAGGFFTNW